MDLRESELLGDTIGQHWYYRAKLAALRRLLGPGQAGTVLDVGAGSGFFTRELLAAGRAEAGICVDPFYTAEGETRIAGRPLRFRREIPPGAADLLLLMDVLEHVDDDLALLRAALAAVAPGARVIVSVPAFAWLWSGHDVFLGHRRRYTLHGIEQVLRQAGLAIELGCYFYAGLLPLAAATRLAARAAGARAPKSQMRPVGRGLNEALYRICAAELPFFRANRLAGLTAFVRARYDAPAAAEAGRAVFPPAGQKPHA